MNDNARIEIWDIERDAFEMAKTAVDIEQLPEAGEDAEEQ